MLIILWVHWWARKVLFNGGCVDCSILMQRAKTLQEVVKFDLGTSQGLVGGSPEK